MKIRTNTTIDAELKKEIDLLGFNVSELVELGFKVMLEKRKKIWKHIIENETPEGEASLTVMDSKKSGLLWIRSYDHNDFIDSYLNIGVV